MSAGTIWLVRHASTDWTGVRWAGRTDLPLNDRGQAEAAALASRLAAVLDQPAFVSSPSLRAMQTAEALAGSFGADVAALPDLKEADLGEVDGLTFDELTVVFPAIAEATLAGRNDVDWPGGERAVELTERVTRAWARLTAWESAGDLVAVTHGGVIAALLRLALHPGAELPPWAGPASAVRLVVDRDRWRIET